MSKKEFNIKNPPNILVILSDQQRANLHLPLKWQRRKLPAMTLLRRYGIEFVNAFCNSCMCSPSRSSLLTSLYPAQHGVTATLSFGGDYSITETELDPSVPNLAKMLEKWYDCQYRGKWHINKGGQNDAHPEQSLVPSDLAIFGFRGWITPDSGEDTKLENFGGGYADHDTDYVQQAVEYVRDWKKKKARGDNPRPFFMVLSIVNPHDVLSYPDTYIDGGYTEEWLKGDKKTPIPIPPGSNEDLLYNYKPASQWQNKVTMAAAFGAINTKKKKQEYVNFYANLVAQNDQKIAHVLEEFYNRKKDGFFGKPKKMGEETLIVRLSDHGEMGMAHGGLRQKTFNAYEESLRVPFIFTHPMLNDSGQPIKTENLASLIDVMPTLAGLLGIDPPQNIRGKDLSENIYDPFTSKPQQDSVLFTYDDVRAGNPDMAEVTRAANRLRSVRTRNWKYTRYFHQLGSFVEEYEMYFLTGQGYDQKPGGKLTKLEKKLNQLLKKYPLEFVNLAYPNNEHMKDWPDWVKQGLKLKRKEMAKLLEAKEKTILTLQQVEIRKGLKKMSLIK